MSLDILWFIIVAVFWTGFFVLEGFDFGVGVLHKAVGRTDTERRVAINTIGPLWDGNEVWLIVGGAAIFAAFPGWYATWFSAGYLALMLVLVALIIRGVSFEWRSQRRHRPLARHLELDADHRLRADPAAARRGPRRPARRPAHRQQRRVHRVFWDLLTPYGLWVGLTLLVLCLLHGATFLGLKAAGAVRERSRMLARPARLAGPRARRRLRRLDRSRSPTAASGGSSPPPYPCSPRSPPHCSSGPATKAGPSPPPRSPSAAPSRPCSPTSTPT